ncbi:MAG: hypothetical protein N2376_12080 [Clostridia bacterium]|nr:hypothetical protein [Clostridia bacterium]
MRMTTKLLVILITLSLALTCTVSLADVGNHNSYSSHSSSSSSHSSGSDTLDGIVAIFQLFRLFFISPWYIKILIIGVIAYLFISSSVKERKIKKQYVMSDKSSLNSFETTEKELLEIAKHKYLEQRGPEAKVNYIETSGYSETPDNHQITFFVKDAKSNDYYIMVLAHPLLQAGRFDEGSFSLVSLEKLNKKTGQREIKLPEKQDSNP